MIKQLLTIFFCVFALHSTCKAQSSIKAQVGLSYIEHFSVGGSLNFKGNQNISLLYGSNFFLKTADFSSLLVQYHYQITRLKFKNFTPFVGIKGGNSVYTNEYYKWNVVSLIPFIGLNYPVKNNLELLLEAGPAFSFEYQAKRISYGEIGNYKKLLPEVKIGISYTLFRNYK